MKKEENIPLEQELKKMLEPFNLEWIPIYDNSADKTLKESKVKHNNKTKVNTKGSGIETFKLSIKNPVPEYKCFFINQQEAYKVQWIFYLFGIQTSVGEKSESEISMQLTLSQVKKFISKIKTNWENYK